MAAWNALLLDTYPFLRHELLAALEANNCVGSHFGWLPRHIGVYDEQGLAAAMPLYEKHNGYGELVFDHAWADAYQRVGRPYYPKLVCAVPYTPATGQRLLCRPGLCDQAYPLLLETALDLARQGGASGFHCLFPVESEHAWLTSQGLFSRHDCQFHWRNRGYRDFEDFLATLSSRKRKNIRQERRRAQGAGVELSVLDGHRATEAHWWHFTHFYQQTFEDKWGTPTLNQGFFQQVAEAMPEQVLLVLAERNRRPIAGALLFRSDRVLYGRHWGAVEQVNSLHFEACYYQGIEYAIAQGIEVFEPGAQGEHKIARGFEPTLTRSAHWLADARFRSAIGRFCQQERDAVADYMQEVRRHLPYKEEVAL